MAFGPITSWQIDGGKVETVTFNFLRFQNHCGLKLKDACFLEEKLDTPRQHFKKQGNHFADKGPYSQSYSFSNSHVQM